MKMPIFILAMLLSTGLIAGPVMTTTVEKVRVRPTVAYVKLEGCRKYNKIRLNSDYGKAMYSTAVVAATASKKVRVEFKESDGCQTVESEFLYFEVLY